MKIHTCIKDARNMELIELEAINRRLANVQAQTTEIENEPQENQEVADKARKKKNKKRV